MYYFISHSLQHLGVSSDLGIQNTTNPYNMFPQTIPSQRQEWTLWYPSVLQKQESGYLPGTDPLPCSPVLVSPPTPQIASLIMKTEPSVICFCSPIPNSNPEALVRFWTLPSQRCQIAGICTTDYLFQTLPHNMWRWCSKRLHCLKMVKCFPSEPGFSVSQARGTLKL